MAKCPLTFAKKCECNVCARDAKLAFAIQMGENQSLKKADEWRHLLHITPVPLWLCWREEDDSILDLAPPMPPNARNTPKHSRKLRSIYDALLLLCASVHILSAKEISVSEARIGQELMAQYSIIALRLGFKLTVNNHLVMHIADMIRLFGPVQNWWLFPFERFNGVLERVNHNGHDGGALEVTLMRSRIQAQLLFDFSAAIPTDAHPLERKLLHAKQTYFDGLSG